MNEFRKSEVEISVMDVGVDIIYFYTLSYDSENEDLYEVVDNLLTVQGHKPSPIVTGKQIFLLLNF